MSLSFSCFVLIDTSLVFLISFVNCLEDLAIAANISPSFRVLNRFCGIRGGGLGIIRDTAAKGLHVLLGGFFHL